MNMGIKIIMKKIIKLLKNPNKVLKINPQNKTVLLNKDKELKAKFLNKVPQKQKNLTLFLKKHLSSLICQKSMPH